MSWSRRAPRALREREPAAPARWGGRRGWGARNRRGGRSSGCVRGGWRGNLAPAPPEPTGREEDRPRDRDGCRMLGMGGNGCFSSHRRGRRQQKWKNCAWNGNLPGSRREPSSPAAAGGLRPAAPAGTAARGFGRSPAPRSARLVPRLGGRAVVAPVRPGACRWVTLATDVSCFPIWAAFLWAAQ